jgi:hypothetical protein
MDRSALAIISSKLGRAANGGVANCEWENCELRIANGRVGN